MHTEQSSCNSHCESSAPSHFLRAKAKLETNENESETRRQPANCYGEKSNCISGKLTKFPIYVPFVCLLQAGSTPALTKRARPFSEPAGCALIRQSHFIMNDPASKLVRMAADQPTLRVAICTIRFAKTTLESGPMDFNAGFSLRLSKPKTHLSQAQTIECKQMAR